MNLLRPLFLSAVILVSPAAAHDDEHQFTEPWDDDLMIAPLNPEVSCDGLLIPCETEQELRPLEPIILEDGTEFYPFSEDGPIDGIFRCDNGTLTLNVETELGFGVTCKKRPVVGEGQTDEAPTQVAPNLGF